MIIGMGSDLVYIPRLERAIDRHGGRFLHRIFTEQERLYAYSCPHPLRAYARRFAAKEAAAKALGWGIWRNGISWKDFEVTRKESGQPLLILRKHAASLIESRAPIYTTHISLSDDGHYAQAVVIIED